MVALANVGHPPVGDHVWAMVLVAGGAVLVAYGFKDTGAMIVGGGLALFKGHTDEAGK